MMYAVNVAIVTRKGEWEGARMVPTFYLDSDVQGITGVEHAARVAAEVVNPLGLIPADDIAVYTVPVSAGTSNGFTREWNEQVRAAIARRV